ncbi:sugar transporter SWEET1 isoform X2 [Chanos chanos]|uniref:Sugar transporter SWEET1 n=1 Tax=Chanos chanos TaxID=29144 RepID=A0A6J2W620_CHACN|nr:sugar transporter SWEET1 isoform X2 [Chanos chanos]
MDFLQLLSWACIIFTVGMFSTGLTDLKKMKASQSADNVQFLPFLTTCLNNLGWLYYGMLKKDGTVLLVNVIGASLQALYIFMYCYYTKEKTLAMVTVLCVSWVYFDMISPKGDAQLSQLGLACSVFTVSMYLSPLADLVDIIRTHSVERLSFSLTVMTFLTSTSWTLYGLQIHDLYIMVPNTPGIATSLIRFCLFWKFAAAKQDKPYHKLIHT